MLSVAISTDPISAVPIEAPRLVAVFCSPPTSAVSLSDTADTVTAPSCEASAPRPRPISTIGMFSTVASASGSIPATRKPMPTISSSSPIRTTRRGLAFGHSLGMPIAASSSAMDSGTSRTPVCSALSPSTTERNSGTAKKAPAWIMNWAKNIPSPPVSCRLRSMLGRTSGCRADRVRGGGGLQPALPAQESVDDQQSDRR